MKSKSLRLVLAAGLFFGPALTLQANIDAALQLQVKCFFQEKTAASSDRESGKVGIVRVDSKVLLKLLSRRVGLAFPDGSQLIVAGDGSVYVADAKGNKLRDVSRFFGAKADVASLLFNGKRNLVNGEEKSRNYYPIAFSMNLPGLRGDIAGILTEDYTVSPATRTGVQFTAANANSDVNGKGAFDGKPAFFEGNLSLQGREASLTR